MGSEQHKYNNRYFSGIQNKNILNLIKIIRKYCLLTSNIKYQNGLAEGRTIIAVFGRRKEMNTGLPIYHEILRYLQFFHTSSSFKKQILIKFHFSTLPSCYNKNKNSNHSKVAIKFLGQPNCLECLCYFMYNRIKK